MCVVKTQTKGRKTWGRENLLRTGLAQEWGSQNVDRKECMSESEFCNTAGSV